MAEIKVPIDEGGVRTKIVMELLESSAESRKILLDQDKELKLREHWIQLHNSTSQILNTVLQDLGERLGESTESSKNMRKRNTNVNL